MRAAALVLALLLVPLAGCFEQPSSPTPTPRVTVGSPGTPALPSVPLPSPTPIDIPTRPPLPDDPRWMVVLSALSPDGATLSVGNATWIELVVRGNVTWSGEAVLVGPDGAPALTCQGESFPTGLCTTAKPDPHPGEYRIQMRVESEDELHVQVRVVPLHAPPVPTPPGRVVYLRDGGPEVASRFDDTFHVDAGYEALRFHAQGVGREVFLRAPTGGVHGCVDGTCTVELHSEPGLWTVTFPDGIAGGARVEARGTADELPVERLNENHTVHVGPHLVANQSAPVAEGFYVEANFSFLFLRAVVPEAFASTSAAIRVLGPDGETAFECEPSPEPCAVTLPGREGLWHAVYEGPLARHGLLTAYASRYEYDGWSGAALVRDIGAGRSAGELQFQLDEPKLRLLVRTLSAAPIGDDAPSWELRDPEGFTRANGMGTRSLVLLESHEGSVLPAGTWTLLLTPAPGPDRVELRVDAA